MTLLTNISRVFKTGFKAFWRNGWVSSATISILVFTLFIIASLFFLNVTTHTVLSHLEDKIDLLVYFKVNTPETTIFQMKNELLSYQEVKKVDYISRDEALAFFHERHQDDETITKSLEELDENPLEPSLQVKARQANLYSTIANFINQSSYKPEISRVSYNQKDNQRMINQFNKLSGQVRHGGLVLSLIFVVIALLIVFNTIRLAIYTWKDEIRIMRLVGAKNLFIQWPFIVEGAIYGICAALICLLVLYGVLHFIAPKLGSFLPGVDLLAYFQHNVFWIGLVLALIGVSLSVISSFIAVRRYLKI